jgi:dTDP-4-amino-4,6-dideoxygalactose transaminase
MGLVMLDRLDALNDGRRAIAARIHEVVTGVPGLSSVRVPSRAYAVYLRYPVLARDAAQRDSLRAALVASGIGATGSYPRSIVDIPELAELMLPYRNDCPGGRSVAARILTLPTHAYVSARDIDAIADTLRAGWSGSTAAGLLAGPEGRP